MYCISTYKPNLLENACFFFSFVNAPYFYVIKTVNFIQMPIHCHGVMLPSVQNLCAREFMALFSNRVLCQLVQSKFKEMH